MGITTHSPIFSQIRPLVADFCFIRNCKMYIDSNIGVKGVGKSKRFASLGVFIFSITIHKPIFNQVRGLVNKGTMC